MDPRRPLPPDMRQVEPPPNNPHALFFLVPRYNERGGALGDSVSSAPEAKIRISSSVSFNRKPSLRSSSGKRGTLNISFNQRSVSRNPLRHIPILWIKSFCDSAPWASPWLERGNVPERIVWLAMWLPVRVFGNRSASRILTQPIFEIIYLHLFDTWCSTTKLRHSFVNTKDSAEYPGTNRSTLNVSSPVSKAQKIGFIFSVLWK